MSAPKHVRGDWGAYRRRRPSPPSGGKKRFGFALITVVTTVLGTLGLLAATATAASASTPGWTATIDCSTGVVSGTGSVTGVTSTTGQNNANGYYEGGLGLRYGSTIIDFEQSDANGDATFTYSFTPPSGATSATLNVSGEKVNDGVNFDVTVTWSACVTGPKAAFTDTVNNLSVNFDASASTGSAPLTYVWDFGDGTAAGNGVSPSHTYAQAGTYSVKLTVTDSAGNSNSVTHKVTVNAAQPPPPTQVTPQSPTHTTPDCTVPGYTETVTPTNQTGVVWSPSGPTTLQPGQSVTYTATPAAGYTFPAGAQTSFVFTNSFDPSKCQTAPPTTPPVTPPTSPPPSHGGGSHTPPASGGSSSSHHGGSGSSSSSSAAGNGGSNQGSGSGGSQVGPVPHTGFTGTFARSVHPYGWVEIPSIVLLCLGVMGLGGFGLMQLKRREAVR